MYLHEYQAKELLAGRGVTIAKGGVADSPEQAERVARDLGGSAWIVKAQIHAGGRGKAGGVTHAGNLEAVVAASRKLLGSRLVTSQTGAAGKPVRQVYVEVACDVAREIYLAVLVDRSLGKLALLASSEGGEQIEAVAQAAPEKIHRLPLPADGKLSTAQARKLAKDLGLEGEAREAVAQIARALPHAFVETDASLIEINPLAVTAQGEVLALDVKMSLDENALYRHPDLAALRDEDYLDPGELEARRYELNYVALEGNIGCLVNGAGLALATLDLIRQQGGAPADFMDVRPVASREQIALGLEMILRNPKVAAVLVNIYGGGILRCDTVAEAIALTARRRGLRVPLVVRAAGTNHEICRKILNDQAIPVRFAKTMAEAARMAISAAGREAA